MIDVCYVYKTTTVVLNRTATIMVVKAYRPVGWDDLEQQNNQK